MLEGPGRLTQILTVISGWKCANVWGKSTNWALSWDWLIRKITNSTCSSHWFWVPEQFFSQFISLFLDLVYCKWDESRSSCPSAAELIAELKYYHMSDLFHWLVTHSRCLCNKVVFWRGHNRLRRVLTPWKRCKSLVHHGKKFVHTQETLLFWRVPRTTAISHLFDHKPRKSLSFLDFYI